MGFGSIDERLHMSETTLVLLSFGLTTAAIVGALTGTSSARQEDYTSSIVDDVSYLCVGAFHTSLSPYYWNLSNGSQYQVEPNIAFCPGAEALSLMGGINVISLAPDNGVAGSRAALATLASIYSSSSAWNKGSMANLALVILLQKYGTSLLSTSQCVPVMTGNTVQCSTQLLNILAPPQSTAAA